MILETAFGAIYLVHAAISLWSLTQLRAFLHATPVIADEPDLERYKGFVRVQMYLALVVIGLLVPGVGVAMLLAARRGLWGLGLVLAVNALVFVVGLYHRRLEVRARGLPVTAAGLAADYRRVSETWVKRPLPDF